MIDCVNMETNTCFFGHGGVAVEVNAHVIRFRGVKPPMEVGTYLRDKNGIKIGDWDYTSSDLCVVFNSIEEVQTVYNLLKNVENNQGGSFKFKEVVFDFTEYKQASMDVIKDAMRVVKRNVTLLMDDGWESHRN